MADSSGAFEMLLHLWWKAGGIWRLLPFAPRGKFSDRKLRLFACGCVRQVWHLWPEERIRCAVDTAERYADGAVSRGELYAVGRPLATRPRGAPEGAWLLAWAAHGAGETPMRAYFSKVAYCAAGAFAWATAGTPGTPAWGTAYAAQAACVRDLFGNPFRPGSLDPAWLTWDGGTVRNMARAIYEGRAFDRLPILGDALEEAGCTDAAILGHCRAGGEHVRGCWVVDLLLGKS
jgi:hypothetical protein